MYDQNLDDGAENAAASQERQIISEDVVKQLCTKVVWKILCNSKEEPKCCNTVISEAEEIATSVAEASTQTSIDWYPHRGRDTFNGRSLDIYFQYLKDAKGHATFRYLIAASEEVPFIGCPNSENAWKLLDPVIKYITAVKQTWMGTEIAAILINEPQEIYSYIKCFTSMRYAQYTVECPYFREKISALTEKVNYIQIEIKKVREHISK